MTILKKTGAVLACLALFLALSCEACTLFSPAREATAFSIRSVKDGVYIGEKLSFPITGKVEVSVRDGKILSIRILKHFSHPDHSAAAIADRIVAAQSLEVDSISGATKSSKILLAAIRRALVKGL